MTWHEQIVSVKVKWDDRQCPPEKQAGCCGEGQCTNKFEFNAQKHLVLQDDPCCPMRRATKEVLQESPQIEKMEEFE